jgi:hypothetical protein
VMRSGMREGDIATQRPGLLRRCQIPIDAGTANKPNRVSQALMATGVSSAPAVCKPTTNTAACDQHDR